MALLYAISIDLFQLNFPPIANDLYLLDIVRRQFANRLVSQIENFFGQADSESVWDQEKSWVAIDFEIIRGSRWVRSAERDRYCFLRGRQGQFKIRFVQTIIFPVYVPFQDNFFGCARVAAVRRFLTARDPPPSLSDLQYSRYREQTF